MGVIQAHASWVLDQLRADVELTVCDGKVNQGVVAPYVLVYLFVQTPDGLLAPDKVKLSGDSDVIDLRAYCHCVGGGVFAAANARDVQDRVRAQLLNVRPVIAGRTCFPVRWFDGQPANRNEELPGAPVVDQVDIYRLETVPA